jgi:hypothetical protein
MRLRRCRAKLQVPVRARLVFRFLTLPVLSCAVEEDEKRVKALKTSFAKLGKLSDALRAAGHLQDKVVCLSLLRRFCLTDCDHRVSLVIIQSGWNRAGAPLLGDDRPFLAHHLLYLMATTKGRCTTCRRPYHRGTVLTGAATRDSLGVNVVLCNPLNCTNIDDSMRLGAVYPSSSVLSVEAEVCLWRFGLMLQKAPTKSSLRWTNTRASARSIVTRWEHKVVQSSCCGASKKLSPHTYQHTLSLALFQKECETMCSATSKLAEPSSKRLCALGLSSCLLSCSCAFCNSRLCFREQKLLGCAAVVECDALV